MDRVRLRSALIIETNSCKNSCIFCSPQGLRRVLTSDELRHVETYLLRQVLDLKKQGLDDHVEISGCDPIEYDKIVPFICYLKNDVCFKTVMLSTHGRLLQDLKMVKNLYRAGLDELRIPLYGSSALIHDSITQEKGSFKETLKGIKNITRVARRIKLFITSLMMKQNAQDMSNIFSLARQYSSNIIFSIPCVSNLVLAKKYVLSPEDMKYYGSMLLKNDVGRDGSLKIKDIPFCIFGDYKKNLINKTGPPLMAKSYAVPGVFKTPVHGLPNYRIKERLSICARCNLRLKCDGFYSSYLQLFDFSGLKPLHRV